MIKNISLKNFRLFSDLNLNVESPLVILSGKNAVGKTSILEAIHICSTTKSHRTADLKNIVKNGSDMCVASVVTDSNTFKFVFSKEGKYLYINNTEIKKMRDFIGNLSIVMFSPNDLILVQGSKQARRGFLDLQLSLIDKSYLLYSSNYKKLLSKRNELLKQTNIDNVLLDIITDQLIESLGFIYQKRLAFIDKLNEHLINISKKLNIDLINLKYIKTYDDNIKESFNNKRKLDLLTKTTNIGTHRDDFKILINNNLAVDYASEGQIRAICIAIKLALKEIIAENNEEPIILLDDVFASLDKTRITSLVEYVKKSKQAFITTTSTLEIPDGLLKNSLVLRISDKGE